MSTLEKLQPARQKTLTPLFTWLSIFIVVLTIVITLLVYHAVNWITLSAPALLIIGWSYLVWWQVRANRAGVWHKQGDELRKRERYDEALAHFNQALKLYPQYLDARYGKGRTLSQMGRYEEALASYDRVLRRAPNAPRVLHSAGFALLRLGRKQEALDAFEQALSLDPNYASAWLNKGHVLSELKRYEEALTAFKRALILDPDSPIAWNNLADTLNDGLKRHADALYICDEALVRGISISGIWAIKGDALQALGRDDEAHVAYETVLTFPTDDFLSWVSTGTALAALGRCDEALVVFESALTFRTDSAGVWRKKAEVLRVLGREDEAQEAERHADELDR